MVPTRPARLALALAAAGLLAGCAAQPGTAGTINGARVTEAELADATGDYVELTAQPTEPVVVLNTLLAAEVLPGIAAKYDIAYSDQEVVDRLAEQAQNLPAGVPEGGFSDAFVDLGRYLFLYSAVQEDPDGEAILGEFTAAMAQADISVSPRYGQAGEGGVIQPVSREWLAPTGPVPQP